GVALRVTGRLVAHAADMVGAHTDERPVVAGRELVARAQVELQRRGERGRGVENAVRIGVGQPFDLGDARTDRRAIRCPVGRQAGCIRLVGTVPGARSLHREPLGHAGDPLQLDAFDYIGRTVDVEGGVAEMYRIE